jgi:cell wall-associated NlpC family hydrolase
MRCAVEIAPVRSAPRGGAEQVTEALLHEPLTVEKQQDGWVRIVTAHGYAGWVKAEALQDGEGELLATCATPLEVARNYLGANYEWGGLTERGIDCSGSFTSHTGAQAGSSQVLRGSRKQPRVRSRLELNDLVT